MNVDRGIGPWLARTVFSKYSSAACVAASFTSEVSQKRIRYRFASRLRTSRQRFALSFRSRHAILITETERREPCRRLSKIDRVSNEYECHLSLVEEAAKLWTRSVIAETRAFRNWPLKKHVVRKVANRAKGLCLRGTFRALSLSLSLSL